MKKSIFGAALLAAASAFAFETWKGDSGEYQMTTELQGPGAYENAGYWYTYTDNADGGASKIEWPAGVTLGNDYSDDALDNIIDYCGGVCGTYSLDKGKITYNPFVGIGFNVAGADDASGAQDIADATAWGGVCIAYTVDNAASLEMGLGDAGDAEIGYDNPAAALPKATTANVKDIAWASFKQAGWGKAKISGTEAAAKLAAIKFKVQAASGSKGSFNIMSVGAYQGGCAATTVSPAIGAKAAQASLKAQLAGRTLSFGKTVAKAEIVNLQGQVVMAASSVKSMDLSKVQAGVYMVRAEGLSQQIMVK